MKKLIEKMSKTQQFVFADFCVMVVSCLAYIIAYLITANIVAVTLLTFIAAFAASFSVLATTVSPPVAMATIMVALTTAMAAIASHIIIFPTYTPEFFFVFVYAFGVIVGNGLAANFAKAGGLSFWKSFILYLLQTIVVYLIFRYAPYFAIPVCGVYVLGILYLLIKARSATNEEA